LAHHKGSAFGGIGQAKQPSQEMFENKLALALQNNSHGFFMIEDESQRIGALNIPHALWKNIRTAPLYFIDVPFQERLKHIIAYYGRLEKDKLITAILRIQKRLGPNETKTTINLLLENNIEGAFTILLKYYDKEYGKALEKRDNIQTLLHKITLEKIDIEKNAIALLSIIK
jgi:tRNA 2-selenouridine synthase